MTPELLKQENERLLVERNALDVQVAALEEQLAEAMAWRKDAEAVHEELASVLKGKDALGERLCAALGLPPSPLSKAVDEAVARLAPALRSAPPGAP